MFSESASTFIEVSGVFNSWETLDTNSCRELSSSCKRFSMVLNASDICSTSEKPVRFTFSSKKPSEILLIEFAISLNGFVKLLAITRDIKIRTRPMPMTTNVTVFVMVSQVSVRSLQET